MFWTSRSFIFLYLCSLMDFSTAEDRCKKEVNIPGMALKGFVFKRISATAPHRCDIACEREVVCQSYNYVFAEKVCELNNRTKEASPENFRSDEVRFYMRRMNGRAPLGSLPELAALSCHEIKLSEGKDTISKKYWLDPTGIGKPVLVYCDMKMEDIDECKSDKPVCDVNANCINTYGSYNCSCKEGYTWDGRSCLADACFHYKNLSDATRKSTYNTSHDVYDDDKLSTGWYRFMGAAGTKMLTTCVPEFRCGTYWSGWLNGSHSTVEDGEVTRTVCFKRGCCCRYTVKISVRSCGSYYIYKLFATPDSNMRYCGSD